MIRWVVPLISVAALALGLGLLVGDVASSLEPSSTSTVVPCRAGVQCVVPAWPASAPDWTVAPCAWWANTSSPQPPPFTVTDRCVADDGSISYAP